MLGIQRSETIIRTVGRGDTLVCPVSLQEFLNPEDEICRVRIAVKGTDGRVASRGTITFFPHFAEAGGECDPDYDLDEGQVDSERFQEWLDAILRCGRQVSMRSEFVN